MSKDWDDAARRYREQKKVLVSGDEVLRAVRELDAFLESSRGQDAIELLAASGRHINFGEELMCSGYGVVYFLDGNGLQKSIEGMGSWIAYSKPEPPQVRRSSAKEAIRAAVNPNMSGKEPRKVMPWLRAELDRIASKAPEAPE